MYLYFEYVFVLIISQLFNIDSFEIRKKIFKQIFLRFFFETTYNNNNLLFLSETDNKNHIIKTYAKIAEDEFKFFDYDHYTLFKKENWFHILIFLLFFKSITKEYFTGVKHYRFSLKNYVEAHKNYMKTTIYKCLKLISYLLSRISSLFKAFKNLKIYCNKNRKTLFRKLHKFLFKNLDDTDDRLIVNNGLFIAKKQLCISNFNNYSHEKAYYKKNR